MGWGEIETEPEFDEWYENLTDEDSATVDFYVDLLAERGVHLGGRTPGNLSGSYASSGSTWGGTSTG